MHGILLTPQNINFFKIIYISAVNGMYGTWSLWSECDRTCGGGTRVRSRSCTNPPAQFGGSDCTSLGPSKETELCSMNACPGKTGDWSWIKLCWVSPPPPPPPPRGVYFTVAIMLVLFLQTIATSWSEFEYDFRIWNQSRFQRRCFSLLLVGRGEGTRNNIGVLCDDLGYTL